jgi:hypothetical protein
VPEVITLAKTIEAWWPQILAFLDTGITNAGTEANNRLIKDAARIAFGFRNLDNQRRRVRLHCKRTMNQLAAARVTSPLKYEEPDYLLAQLRRPWRFLGVTVIHHVRPACSGADWHGSASQPPRVAAQPRRLNSLRTELPGGGWINWSSCGS